MAKNPKTEKQLSLVDYCESFAQLKVNKSRKRGDAPYKPILLLSVIDLISQGRINKNKIFISDELIDTFNKYWDLVSSGAFNGGLALPFFHLKNEKPKFWHLKYNSEYDGGRPQTVPKLREDVDYAYLNDELFSFLLKDSARQELIDALIAAWFSSSQRDLEDLLKVNEDFEKSLVDIENIDESENFDQNPKFYFKKSVVRNAFFRKSIVHIYDYKCALCALKVTQSLTQNIVDGAHIKPLAKFYDSRVTNGIAFCKNHHWAFDKGIFSINSQYKIIVSRNFEEDSPNSKPIKDFHGESILLPKSEKFLPNPEALDWHQENIFRK